MFETIRHSIRAKLTLAVMGTTFVALLVTAILLVAYDYRNYKTAWVADLNAQADILARASEPALEFDDRVSAQHYIELLRVRPHILTAAIYDARGAQFASFVREGVTPHFPRMPQADGYRVVNDQLLFTRQIVGADGPIGTVFLSGQYQLPLRLARYMKIVGSVMIFSLLIALLVSSWTQRAITRPILALSSLARQVKDRRDFAMRVNKTSDDEVGDLVDSINEMLSELGRQAWESERANITLAHEIATRQDAERALRAADKRKDEFLATLAHELRNPLAPLRNGLEILRLAGNDSGEAHAAREAMNRQLIQLVRLVDDLLDVTRITTGRLVMQREDVMLRSVVETAIDTIAPFMATTKHQLQVRIPDEPLLLHGDAVRLTQVFVNLLHNAAKFTPPGGDVTLVAERKANTVTITVSDTGIGIPPEMVPTVFDMFAQLDRSLERQHAGLGVGLSLARRLVELHDGTLEGESEGPGKGSRFTVRLPLGRNAMSERTSPAWGTGADTSSTTPSSS